ncbi:MAG: xanthine dehydrogenase accessory protein XdhC [Steroidobacteraceae bacterium]
MTMGVASEETVVATRLSKALGTPGGRWLRPLSDTWPRVVCQLLEAGEPVVTRLLIAEVRGSSPREPGACMLVSQSGTYGTIGGGNLEWQAMNAARALRTHPVQLRRLVLGRELGQCCGGVVHLWLERFTPADLPFLRRAAHAGSRDSIIAIVTEVSGQAVVRKLLQHGGMQPRLRFSSNSDESATLLERIERDRAALWLYGAGHVAQALIRLMGELPFEVTWIDSRAELLPAALPSNVHPLCVRTPANTVSSAPAGVRFLVMTHDHGLDYALCRKILERNDFEWLGLIGSKSKGARFRSRLARDAIAAESIARLVSPIGVEGINNKWPAAIAVAVAAQLLQGLESPEQRPSSLNVSPSAQARGAVAAGTRGAAAAEAHGPAATGHLRRSAAWGSPSEVLADSCTSPDCAGCAATRGLADQ